MTHVINLYGGPGTGKSTSAAYIFYRLKTLGYVAEYVQEYVKSWAWEGKEVGAYDQVTLLAEQTAREHRLYGKVDVIVTDSPVWLCAYYGDRHLPSALAGGINGYVRGFYRHCEKEDGVKHHHVFLKRTKAYVAKGRYHTEGEAKEIDVHLKEYLRGNNVSFDTSGTDTDALDEVIQRVVGSVSQLPPAPNT